MTRPARVEELSARFVHALVGVRAEEVSLSLQKVRGQTLGAIAVIEGKRGGESRCRHTDLDGLDNGAPPGILIIDQHLAEEIVQKKIRDLRILVVGFLDLAEKAAANDTASAPHQGDPAEVQVPAFALGGFAQQHVALRIGNDLGTIKSPADIFDERRAVCYGARRLWGFEYLGRRDALVFDGGK